MIRIAVPNERSAAEARVALVPDVVDVKRLPRGCTLDDEIVAQACITRDGGIMHEGARAAADAAQENELRAA